MKIENLKYVEPSKTLINMSVTLDKETANQFHGAGETIPFTFHPQDTTPIALAVKELLAKGKYKIATYVATPKSPA